jgi:hypothetical protein
VEKKVLLNDVTTAQEALEGIKDGKPDRLPVRFPAEAGNKNEKMSTGCSFFSSVRRWRC